MEPTNEVATTPRPAAYAIVGRDGEIVGFAITGIGADLNRSNSDITRHQSAPHEVRAMFFSPGSA